jgi:hypothetical protein
VTFTSRGVSNKALLAVIAMNSDLRQEPGVLRDLETDHGILSSVSEHFLDLSRSGNPDLQVVNFFEQRSSKVGKQFGRNDLEVFGS